jgi:hypothetical protein
MKKNILQEEMQVLEELLQSINHIVTPFSFRDELKSIIDPTTRRRLSEKYPRCFLPVRMGNKDIPFLPICNRNGATDKDMIAFSMKLANRLLGREDVDRGMLEITMKKLNRLNTTYSKEIPTPPGPAAKKANVTKAMLMLRRDLDLLRGNNPGIGSDAEPEADFIDMVPKRRQISLP